MAKHNEIGQIGEDIASKYIENNSFSIVCKNYRKKWGEIDIVAEKDNVFHFIEVKTVSRNSYGNKFEQEINNYRPEDNIHFSKIKRLKRAIETYLLEKFKKEPIWQFDIICVFLDHEKRVAKVKFMKNIIL